MVKCLEYLAENFWYNLKWISLQQVDIELNIFWQHVIIRNNYHDLWKYMAPRLSMGQTQLSCEAAN